jgi:hypothetical protein
LEPFYAAEESRAENDRDALCVARLATALLGVQLVLMRNSSGGVPAAAVDDFSIGYCAGFIAALLHSARPEERAQTPLHFENVFCALFGPETGSDLFRRLREDPRNKEIERGVLCSGSDALAWRQNPQNLPLGWRRHCR